MNKIEEIMRVSATQSFETKAAFYRSQPDCCREWLDEAAAETVASTVELVPWNLAESSFFREAIPGIRARLQAKLQEVLERPPTSLPDVAPAPAAPAKRKRGRPSKIPVEVKERALDAWRHQATWKQVAVILYGTQHPSARQIKDAPKILKYFERSKNS